MSIKLNIETPVVKVEAKTGLDVIQYGTLVIGDTTTLPAGSSATVVNVGTEAKAVLNFGVPKGDKGDTGDVASDADNVFTGDNAFDGTITVQTPTTDGQAVNKGYVDNATVAKAQDPITDFNTFVPTAEQKVIVGFRLPNTPDVLNAPNNASGVCVSQCASAGAWPGQMFITDSESTGVWFRGWNTNGAWGEWQKLQGVVGYANGSTGYVKYADGRLQCWGFMSVDSRGIFVATYPVAFIAMPNVITSPNDWQMDDASVKVTALITKYGGVNYSPNTQCWAIKMDLKATTLSKTTSGGCSYIAEGVWKR